MTSKLKVDNIEDTSGNAVITKTSNTVTLGKSGDTVTVASGASLVGGGLSWQSTIKTSTFTASADEGYFIDTSSSAVTVNLPAGVIGAKIAVKDYANTFGSNNLTISANGSEKI